MKRIKEMATRKSTLDLTMPAVKVFYRIINKRLSGISNQQNRDMSMRNMLLDRCMNEVKVFRRTTK